MLFKKLNPVGFYCQKINNYMNGTVLLEEKPNFCGNSENFTAYPSVSTSAELKDITGYYNHMNKHSP